MSEAVKTCVVCAPFDPKHVLQKIVEVVDFVWIQLAGSHVGSSVIAVAGIPLRVYAEGDDVFVDWEPLAKQEMFFALNELSAFRLYVEGVLAADKTIARVKSLVLDKEGGHYLV